MVGKYESLTTQYIMQCTLKRGLFRDHIANRLYYRNDNYPKFLLKTPICTFDAKTGILCSKCDAKLTSGQLNQAAVYSSIKLAKLAEKDQEISKFTLVGSHKVDNDYI